VALGFDEKKIVMLARNVPVASTAAHLQPVRSPGSIPITARDPSGGDSSKFFKLSAKTSTAATSLRSFISARTSFSTAGASKRL
jgi:hypothetical protein